MRGIDAPYYDDIGLEVLLLCGDSSLAEMYRLKFEMDGYRVTSLTSLRDWISARRGWRPDLVVLDLTDESGASFDDLDRLRANKTLRTVPLLILSNRSVDELAQSGLTLRPTEYLLHLAAPDLEHIAQAQSGAGAPLAI